MQNLLVGLIVLGCTAYAVWALLPNAWRRALAATLVRAPWPGPVARRLQKAAAVSSGCGCDGCDRAPAKKPPAATGLPPGEQPIQLHRRSRS